MALRPSFRDRVPGDCCCEEPTGYYDWYRDAPSDPHATTGTNLFVKVPSVIPIPPMNEDSWAENSSSGYWEITIFYPKL